MFTYLLKFMGDMTDQLGVQPGIVGVCLLAQPLLALLSLLGFVQYFCT